MHTNKVRSDKAGPKGYRVVTRSANEDKRNGCGVTEKTKENKKQTEAISKKELKTETSKAP